MNVETITIPFDEVLLPARRLSTKVFDCLYEQGKLRYIKCGDSEIIRMIYFAVRDKDWETATVAIGNESIVEKENSFSISYSALHSLNDILYEADICINADNDTLRFQVKGRASSSFYRNRIGICVLHPVRECIGSEVMISRPDKSTYSSNFPTTISPHQPFKDVQLMRYRINGGSHITLAFEGDIFETEDQRNWSDNSFKTYSTPLDLPKPVQVSVGDEIKQAVELHINRQDLKSYGKF